MRWLRLVLRVLGWLLTPLVAWAASFFGATLGALIAGTVNQPDSGLVVTLTAGTVGGIGGLLLWMRLLRRSPRLRHSLHLTREGVPADVAVVAVGPGKLTPDNPTPAPPAHSDP